MARSLRHSATWLVWLTLAAACGPDPGAPPSAEPPSILLVTLDTVRADRLGAYGHAGARTPTVDRLAREGVLFEAALATAPITLPSHASILTGVAPHVHGVRDNGIFVLQPEAPLVSEALHEAGWRTAAFVGSYVLDAKFGLDQGFEVYSGPSLSHDLAGLPAERPAAEVVDDALAWLETLAPEERFFVWVHFYDPHEPYSPPQPWAEGLADPYDAEIAYCDAQLGRLLEAPALRRRAGTLVVALTADHGESLGEHGEQTHGVFVYQSTVRVPLVLWGARLGAARGSRVAEPVSQVEIAPTLLELAGVPRERLPAAEGPTLLERGPRGIALESYLPYHSLGWRALRGVVWEGYKLVDAGRPELYDLTRDPQETRDLAAEQPDRVAALQRRLERTFAATPTWGSPRALEPADRKRLEALGYLAGSSGGDPFGAGLPDPRERIGDLKVLDDAARALDAWARVVNGPPAATAWQNGERRKEARALLEAARARLEPVLAVNPGNFQVAASLGAVEARLGHGDEAIRLLERAAELQPAAVDNRYNLANVYREQGRLDEALRVIQEIHQADPDFLPVYLWMSQYHASRDEYGRAVGWLQALAERAASDPDLRRQVGSRLWELSAAMRRRGQEPVPPPAVGGERAQAQPGAL